MNWSVESISFNRGREMMMTIILISPQEIYLDLIPSSQLKLDAPTPPRIIGSHPHRTAAISRARGHPSHQTHRWSGACAAHAARGVEGGVACACAGDCGI